MLIFFFHVFDVLSFHFVHVFHVTWSRYRLKSTPVVPWIVTVSVLHGVQEVSFPRSCFLTRSKFLSLVKGLRDTLKITVGYKCTCADDTRTGTTTEVLQNRLTPEKCPHLLSHEMTGQVDSGALHQFLSSPARRIVSSCCLLLLGRALFCSREGCAAMPSSHSLQL